MKRFYIILLLLINLIKADECGVFNNVLQTRHNPSKIESSSSYIFNSKGCGLYTGKIEGDLFCNGNNAYALGKYGKSIDESIFKWEFENSTASTNVGGSDSVTIKTENEILTNTKYKNIKQDYNHYSFTWAPSGDNPEVKKIENILNSVVISNVEDKDLKIGQFLTAGWKEAELSFTSTPKSIKIGKLQVNGSNKFTANLEAKESIEITEFDVTSSGEDSIFLKAPVIKIAKEYTNKMDLSNDNNHIVIYADKLYIGEIDFGQRNKLEIHPYTPGKKVEVYIRQVNFSSNSQIIMDSGDYYIKDINIPGSGDNVVLMKANDENQIINLIVDPENENHDFIIGSNFGINSDGLGDNNFGSFNPANFRIFVNGDFETGGGGSTINALIYVTGEVDLGAPTYVRGAISSNYDITIGNNSKFYWDDRISAQFKECSAEFDNNYVCGIFPSGIVSYKTFTVNGLSPKICGSSFVSANIYNDSNENLKCSANLNCVSSNVCRVVKPPLNTYNPSLLESEEVLNWPDGLNLTQSDYEDKTFKDTNVNIYFSPSKSYTNFNRKYMTIGTLQFDNTKAELNFQPGDYYFEEMDFKNSDITINLPSSGSVRIFIRDDFKFDTGNLVVNGDKNNLFIFVDHGFTIENGSSSDNIDFKGYIYAKGDIKLKDISNNFSITGAITSESNLEIDSDNLKIYYVSPSNELGYVNCPLCYALNNNGKWISFEGLNAYFDFPRKIGIINDSNNTLYDLNVSQIETDPSWLSITSPESYAIKDSNDSIVNRPIENTIIYETIFGNYSHTKKGNGSVTRWAPSFNIGDFFNTQIITTADFGDYDLSGFDNYYSIDTYGISGNFKGDRNLTYYATYFDEEGRKYRVQLDYCDIEEKHKKVTTGLFDALDYNRSCDNPYFNDIDVFICNRVNLFDRNISTKIVNQEFNLTIVSLNSDMNDTEIAINKEALYRLYDVNNSLPLTDWREFNASISNNIIDSFKIDRASRNVRVEFKFCQKKNANYTMIFPLKLCQLDPDNYEYNITFSSDNFAIRPYGFRIFGNKEYKRAVENFNIVIKAVDEGNYSLNSGDVSSVKGVKDYNESIDNLNLQAKFYTPSEKETRQMNLDIYDKNDTNITRVAFCPDNGDFSVVGDKYFKDGELNTTLNYSESGVLEINISEKRGKEFAYVDEDDTPDNLRYIKSSHLIYDIEDINKTDLLLFIPYKFTTTAEYFTIPDNPNNWVYISNEVTKSNLTYKIPKMAAIIKYIIKAYSKDNKLLKNYTKTCFPDYTSNAPSVNGLKLNTTFDMFLDFILNSTQNTNISLFVTDKDNHPIWTMNERMNLNSGLNNIQEWINPVSFNRGVGIAKIYFNINKNYRIPQKEINITLKEVNTSTSWMNNPYATNIFIGKEINKSIKFLYGRVDVRNIATLGNEANSTIKYEYWDNFYGWILNKDHNSTFGDINVSKCLIPSDVLLKPQDIQKGIEKIVIETNHSLPYAVKLHFAIPEWLWYHPLAKGYEDPSNDNLDCLTHPCMNVEFKKYSKGWGGAGVNNPKYKETNRTVKINSSSKIKANKSEVKRVNW